MNPGPITLDLVLVGGGHSHVEVLRRFGMRPEPGVRLTLVSAAARTPYSGMLPGLVAGHYEPDEAYVDLRPLARFAGARMLTAQATGVDPDARVLRCAGRPPVPWDLLSLDTGSTPAASAIEGARDRALPVKPVDRFLEGLREIEQALLERAGRLELLVIGAGAGGVELSLALRHRLHTLLVARRMDAGGLAITVVEANVEPLAGHEDGARRRLLAALEARGIALACGRRVVALDDDRARCEPGPDLPCDRAVLVTHATAPEWPRASGLAVDGRGFVRVAPTLRSVSHEDVYAAGDVAAIEGRALAKSGVYAVRQGPVLAENLRRACRGARLRPYRPQRRALALVSTGDRRAVASRGALAVEGAWVWRLKDRIDRRWMAKYRELPEMVPVAGEEDAGAGTAMHCAGCGSKVASDVLRRVLARLARPSGTGVAVGLGTPDDAAVLEVPADKVLVQSVDQFRAFVDDPWTFGRITAVHCLADLHATGATPRTAQALVTIAWAAPAKIEHDLEALLAGALEVLGREDVSLVGGHTSEGPETAFGLAVNGDVDPDALLRKSGLRPGDALVLTKPLGTGVVFAADMRARAPGPVVAAALASMQVSNAAAARCLAGHGATACTDVTGFGLLGHLLEMLEASGARAAIDIDRVPPLPGALDLLSNGFASSLQPANEKALAAVAGACDPVRRALLCDPQTAGGLLAGVPAERAAACVARLRSLGHPEATVVGEIRARESDGATHVELRS